MQKITPCLWFNFNAEEAVRHYLGIFRSGRIVRTLHYGDAQPELKGRVLMIEFEIEGQLFQALNGGFHARKADWPAQHPSVVIAVDDIHAAMRQVGQAGGEVLGEPMEIPGIGHYVSFMDTERNRVSMLQPFPRAAQA